MLPPISAVSAADVSLQSSGPKPDNAAVASVPAATPSADKDAPMNSPSDTVRAVSGELRLSQNSTVLAETLGKLMNLARMENETAGAYASRLITAMQALPADQKAMLEQALGKLLKGLSVAILADALKNSTGPDAARLAVIFELARSVQTNGSTKTGRSSYLQDAMPRAPSLQPMKIAQPMLPSTEGRIQADATPTIQSPFGKTGALFAAIADEPLPPAKPMPQAGAANEPTPKVTTPLDGAAKQLANVNGGEPKQGATSPRSTPLPVLNEIAVAVGARKDSSTSKLQTIASATFSNPAPDEITRTPDPILTAARFQELRLDPEALKQQFSNTNPKDMEALLLAVLTGKLPTRSNGADDTTLPLILPLTKDNAQTEPKATTPTPPSSAANTTDTTDGEIASQLRADMQVAHKAMVATDLKNAMLDQPALQSAVAAMVTKEGTPLPFVNYPAEKEEPESDTPPRGRWPSSSEGEQNPEEQPGDQNSEQPDQEERVAANDEAGDQSLSIGASEDGRVGDAESYYLRMSSFA